ncbi:hypothetical protein ACFOD1_03465 [Pseudidiomarina halophila]|uniref:Uncharacterized protein n=1 Tax=Pseudidiomarina halophila TaxID=1449799 RepID=A0A432XZ81_9GAMM|nr:hypothetical protein [Pseudidiomarina halophila]RUO54007.1 hypothetical protein CWI69_00810 [Pseudidiomarina halophila]
MDAPAIKQLIHQKQLAKTTWLYSLERATAMIQQFDSEITALEAQLALKLNESASAPDNRK